MQLMQILGITQFSLNSIITRSLSSTCKVLLALLGISLVSIFPVQYGQAATVNPIKWHPGHYTMLVGDPNNPNLMNEVYTELAETPALRGVVIRFEWSELEKTLGVYNFKSIDARLKELTARNKRLVILLETKSFDKTKLVPDYLLSAKYDGGVFPIGAYGSNVVKGYNLKLWNNAVKERLAALITALGKRYDSSPNFEGIGLQETALGNPIKPLTNAQIDSFYKNLIDMDSHMRSQFPHTMVFQFTNYPRPLIKSVVDNLKITGGMLAATDIFMEDPGLLFPGSPPGIYTYFPKNNGLMPLGAQVEEPNYFNTRHDGKGYKPTIAQILKFAKDNLHVNYLFLDQNSKNLYQSPRSSQCKSTENQSDRRTYIELS